jgi:hypothetical protein
LIKLIKALKNKKNPPFEFQVVLPPTKFTLRFQPDFSEKGVGSANINEPQAAKEFYYAF